MVLTRGTTPAEIIGSIGVPQLSEEFLATSESADLSAGGNGEPWYH